MMKLMSDECSFVIMNPNVEHDLCCDGIKLLFSCSLLFVSLFINEVHAADCVHAECGDAKKRLG
jgi:hypothetical protein